MTKSDIRVTSLERIQAFITNREKINHRFANEIIDRSFSKHPIDWENYQRIKSFNKALIRKFF